jgi:glycosyltransferase involved in cell wall biosynthesis
MVDSEFVKREVVEELQLTPDKVSVVYPGVDERFRPQQPEEILAFKKAAGLPERYILYVGTIEPRKNLPLLLRAFHQAKASFPSDLRLVLAGPLGWQYEEVFSIRERLDLKSWVLLPGYTPEEKLPLLYGGAELFVYPSLYEGFGLPPLEAMACGVPVITSRAGALPEVVGEAGLLVSPVEEEGWAKAMQEVLRSKEIKAALQKKGFSQARLFSWKNTAAAALHSYHLVDTSA